MGNFFKKYRLFILVGILLIILLIGLIWKSPNEKLTKYLTKNGYIYNSDSELIQEENSLESYENAQIDNYTSTTFNYNNSTFYEINRFKEDGYENSYNLSYNIMNGHLTGGYQKTDQYDTWYVEATYNIITDEFTCDVNGYKGMREYCEILQEKIQEFESNIYILLDDSKTSDYYFKKMENKN